MAHTFRRSKSWGSDDYEFEREMKDRRKKGKKMKKLRKTTRYIDDRPDDDRYDREKEDMMIVSYGDRD